MYLKAKNATAFLMIILVDTPTSPHPGDIDYSVQQCCFQDASIYAESVTAANQGCLLCNFDTLHCSEKGP